MKEVWVIDDNWEVELPTIQAAPSLRGASFTGFSNGAEALAWMASDACPRLPDCCVFDVLSGDAERAIASFDIHTGLKTALSLTEALHEKGHKLERALFKSRTASLAERALVAFQLERPDIASATLLQRYKNGCLEWRVDENEGYEPPFTTGVVEDFLTAHSYLRRGAVYARLGTMIHPLYNALEDTAVEAEEGASFVRFRNGFGGAKVGRLALDVAAAKELAGKGYDIVLAVRDLPQAWPGLRNLVALILLEDEGLIGHHRVLMQSRKISVLADPQATVAGDETSLVFTARDGQRLSLAQGQIVTIDTVAGKLYPQEFPVMDMEIIAPRLKEAAEELADEMQPHLKVLAEPLPAFMVNVSLPEDCIVERSFGLTRSEMFIAPSVAPEAWAPFREMLVGQGVALRRFLSNRTEAAQDLPVILRKKQRYASLYRETCQVPSVVKGYGGGDVFRLYDIPAEEFLDASDLAVFDSLYGRDTRGVQLAKKIPDLYRAQLQALESVRQSGGILPQLLIPAVKSAQDIAFVQNLAREVAPGTAIVWGSMIETVEACNDIEAIAKRVGFVSFGTNDLTAAVHKISRYDSGKQHYLKGLTHSTRALIKETVERARKANPDLHVSICGEVASDLPSLLALRDEGVRIDAFSVPPTLKNTAFLPLAYQHHLLQSAIDATRPHDFSSSGRNQGLRLG